MKRRDNHQKLSLGAIQSEHIVRHPLLDLCNTCLQLLYGIQQASWSSWFEAYIDLHVICLVMVATATLLDDVGDRLIVNRKQSSRNSEQIPEELHVKSCWLGE